LDELLIFSLNWSSNEGNDVGDVLSSLEVVSVLDVGVHDRDVLGDLRDVLEGIGGNSSGVEALGPLLESRDVSRDIFAVLNVSWDILDDSVNFLDSLDVALESTFLEVRDGNLDHGFEVLGISDAGINVLEVLILNESVKESFDQVNVVSGGGSDSVWESRGWDWSNGGGEDVSDVLSDLLELSVGPLGRDVLDISEDL